MAKLSQYTHVDPADDILVAGLTGDARNVLVRLAGLLAQLRAAAGAGDLVQETLVRAAEDVRVAGQAADALSALAQHVNDSIDTLGHQKDAIDGDLQATKVALGRIAAALSTETNVRAAEDVRVANEAAASLDTVAHQINASLDTLGHQKDAIDADLQAAKAALGRTAADLSTETNVRAAEDVRVANEAAASLDTVAHQINASLDTLGHQKDAIDADLQRSKLDLATRINSIAEWDLVTKFGCAPDGFHSFRDHGYTLDQAQALAPWITSIDQSWECAAIQRAINLNAGSSHGVIILLREGLWTVDRTVLANFHCVTIQGKSTCTTTIKRIGDFGPALIQGGSSYGYIGGGALHDCHLADDGAQTLAVSPYQLVIDGASSIRNRGVTHETRTGAWAILGCNEVRYPDAHVLMLDGPAAQTVGGVTYRRRGAYVGASVNAALGDPGQQASDIWIGGLNVKPHAPGAFEHDCGLYLAAVDGLWGSDVHVEGSISAGIHLRRGGAAPVNNVTLIGYMTDISQGHGLILEGTAGSGGELYQPTRLNLEGTASANTMGLAGGCGVLETGTGTVDATVRCGIDGYKGDAIRTEGTATRNLNLELRNVGRGGGGLAANVNSPDTAIRVRRIGYGGGFGPVRLGPAATGASLSFDTIAGSTGDGVVIEGLSQTVAGNRVTGAAGAGVRIKAGAVDHVVSVTNLKGNAGGAIVDESNGAGLVGGYLS